MKILSAKYSENVKGYHSHYHDAHELLYIVSGRIAVNIGGQEREAGAGSLLVFSRFEEHSVRVLSSEYRRYTLLISSEFARGDDYLLSSVLVNRSGSFDRRLYGILYGLSDCTLSAIIEETPQTFRLRGFEHKTKRDV